MSSRYSSAGQATKGGSECESANLLGRSIPDKVLRSEDRSSLLAILHQGTSSRIAPIAARANEKGPAVSRRAFVINHPSSGADAIADSFGHECRGTETRPVAISVSPEGPLTP
jgi:hypothetical protein